MNFRILIIAAIFGLLLLGCSNEKQKDDAQKTNQSELAPGVHQVTVEEILQANSYTYLRVKENDKEDWIAITRRDNIEKGMTIYYKDAMEMTNFHSTDLDRDFESVWFVQTVSDQPITNNPSMTGMQPHTNVKPEADETISIEPVSGGITIAQLFDDKTSYGGKTVKIKGKVVKVNNGVMGKNWLHIQDGTGDGENYDLTVTTKDNAQVGQVVVVEGSVTLDKDFGSGYQYAIILEDSKVTVETSL